MAINLPYPSLVFVPLDVLTAEQLNQIVSNVSTVASNTPDTTTPNIINFGTRKIMWGSTTIRNAASGTDVTATVNFPSSFTSVPVITATVNNWIGLPSVMTTNVTKTGFTLVARHNQGTTQDLPINWIAIG